MIDVEVHNNNIDRALRDLKRKVKDSGLFLELRKKEFYTKPSEIRREVRARARTRAKYQDLKEKIDNNY
ncbi:MAG: 30S ribosomal protein S21 [Candidatus Pacebacteria bacterium]|jgi:small subunit ribosomal protein S21|nr:30S ribosomal protein S21 [Candidatus Paceibacterota bacterium]|tara:strand:- start:3 stop:209 length:207 start_codon:yes stop_codon:yes gene_type:complete